MLCYNKRQKTTAKNNQSINSILPHCIRVVGGQSRLFFIFVILFFQISLSLSATLCLFRLQIAHAARLRLTWWHIGEVAASQKFGRGSNLQIRIAVSAGILPLSRQYARYLPYGLYRFVVCFFYSICFLSDMFVRYFLLSIRSFASANAFLISFSNSDFGGRLVQIRQRQYLPYPFQAVLFGHDLLRCKG